MKTNAPKQVTWWVAVIVGAAGILANFGTIPVLSGYSFWLVAIGFIILALATILRGF